MNVAQIITHLDAHGFEDIDTNIKVDLIYDTITEFAGLTDWPWLDAEADLTLGAGDTTPTLPADFLRPVSIVVPVLGYALVPERMERINKRYSDNLTLSDAPVYYYPVADAIKVYPIPDTTYTAKLQYKRQQAELQSSSAESAIIVPKRHHRGIIVNGVLAALFAMEDDPDNEAIFQRRYERRVQIATSDLWRTQDDRPDYVEDLDDHDFLIWG